jgi:uncharacterized protein with ParB-like and HNH nuclease domain
MSYQTETIANILERLNVNYFLPAIQREYVWHPDQIIQLFDSIMRQYPIGSFLFWQIKPENREKWDAYRFVQHFKQAGTHNELADTSGIDPLTLILDGQQRLTSLYIGLRGTYTIKKKWMAWDNPKSWVTQSLYLDLLQDPQSSTDDTDEGIHFGFRFMETPPEADGTSFWFKVGDILDCTSYDLYHQLQDRETDKLPESTTKTQMKIFRQNLDYLYYAIWNKHNIAYYTEYDQDYDRVLTIFVRANQGGTKLSKSDLLLSMVTAKWGMMNARDEIYAFVDRLNMQSSRKNDFDKDFIMKTCLMLTDLPVQYKVENFNNQNLRHIYENWRQIKSSIETAVNLINSFGIDRETLTSVNAFIPVIYYLHLHQPATFLDNIPFKVKNIALIRKWLLTALLSNTFSGQSDSALATARRVIRERAQTSDDFPAQGLNAELRRAGRKVTLDDESINDVLGLEYGKPLTFLAQSLLYNITDRGTRTYHQEYIFPKSFFRPRQMSKAGISSGQQDQFTELANTLANLLLLTPEEHAEQQVNQSLETWLQSRDAGFRERHLIPEDDALLRFENFGLFIEARQNLIRQCILHQLQES